MSLRICALNSSTIAKIASSPSPSTTIGVPAFTDSPTTELIGRLQSETAAGFEQAGRQHAIRPEQAGHAVQRLGRRLTLGGQHQAFVDAGDTVPLDHAERPRLQ